MRDVDRLSDEELVRRAQEAADATRQGYVDVLFRRYYTKVSRWCLRICNDPEEAADVAQEVFLRVYTRLDGFRQESRFSTWLYTVTRSVSINRGKSVALRRMPSIEERAGFEPADTARSIEDVASTRQIGEQLRVAMARDLEPLEAKVLCLHYVDGMTLPAITRSLELTNKSGAKAFIVNGKRKLKRSFGSWLETQNRSGGASNA